jgi:hypothetical protein
MSRAKSGGGITMNKVTETTTGRKAEPISHSVSMNRPSVIGTSVHYKVPPLYNAQPYSTPLGPNHNFKVGPGAGRVVLKSGSQSRTPPARPLPRGEPEF